MPNIKDISLNQQLQRTTPVFFFLDTCYPSDAIRESQGKVITAILTNLKEFCRFREARIMIGELQIGDSLQWASPTLVPLEQYELNPLLKATASPSEAAFRSAPKEIEHKLSQQALLSSKASPGGFFPPILFFLFNTSEALQAFCSGSEFLFKNEWYRAALRNDTVILACADTSCSALEAQTPKQDVRSVIRTPEITPAGLFFGISCPEDFLLYFEYEQLDSETIGKILALPFCRFQSGGRDGYISRLHKSKQQLPEVTPILVLPDDALFDEWI